MVEYLEVKNENGDPCNGTTVITVREDDVILVALSAQPPHEGLYEHWLA